MIVVIPDILDNVGAAKLRARIKSMNFVDGGSTTGKFGQGIKNNEQLEPGPAAKEVQQTIIQAVASNRTFDMAARPLKIRPPLIARYGPGMEYGTHVDNALMSGNPPMRSDMSFTLFLEDPDKYDGGELVIETPLGDNEIKLPAGGLVLYPTSALHHVAPVTRGQRLVAVCWVQSLIRDPARREILFELETTRHSLFDKDGQSEDFKMVSKSFHNLLRMWAEV
jgi:PKHD-type hydroxylase